MTSNKNTGAQPIRTLSEEDQALIIGALNGLHLSPPNNDQSRGYGLTTPNPSTEPAVTLTLSALIGALQSAGINVISPIEEINHEEHVQSIQDLQATAAAADQDSLRAQRARIFGTNQRPVSPWVLDAGGAVVARQTSAAPTNAAIAQPAIAVQPAVTVQPAAAVQPITTAAQIVVAAQHGAPAPLAAAQSAPTQSISVAAPLAGNGGNAVNPNVSGFVCTSCHTYNAIKSAKDTFYCVIAGRSVGVFQGWHNVQPLVSGVGHACFKKYSSEAEAMTAFENAQAAGYVVVLG